MRTYSTAAAQKYREKGRQIENANGRLRRRQAEQLAAKALLGCEDCGASKDDIRGEQHRLRAEFYSRHPELA